MFAFLLFAAVVVSVVHGFSFSRTNVRSTVLTRTRMSDLYSDVSIVQSDDPKSALLSGVKSYSRAQMNEYVLQWEKVNPTFNPATSEVLNGAWEIVTTGIGAYGMIGFQVIKTISSFIPGSLVDVSDVTVSISGKQSLSTCTRIIVTLRYTNSGSNTYTLLHERSPFSPNLPYQQSSTSHHFLRAYLSSPITTGSTCTASTKIKVLGAGVDVAVNIELESLSGSRLKETYKDFKISAVDIPLKLLPKMVRTYTTCPL